MPAESDGSDDDLGTDSHITGLRPRWRHPDGSRLLWKRSRLRLAAGPSGRFVTIIPVGSLAEADDFARGRGFARVAWGDDLFTGEERAGLTLLGEPPPSGVTLGEVLKVRPSADCPGHAERMGRHGSRAALCLPLFADGPAEPPAKLPGSLTTLPECWACGKVAPQATHIAKRGWATRLFDLAGGGDRQTECYCPGCFAEWGWPDAVS
jgi:hypothetical protein